jgi:tetratricopeptide (TPR) repeat protein
MTRTADERARSARGLALAEELAAELAGPGREAALARFERERADLDQALGRFIEGGDADGAVRMLRALRDGWWGSGRVGEGRRWAEAVLAMAAVRADDAVRATVLDVAGGLAYAREDHAAARRHFEESLALRRPLGDPARVAQSLNHRAGVLRWGLGDLHAARPLMRESLERAREAGHAFLTGAALLGLGTLAVDLGDGDNARAHLGEGISLFIGEHARAAAAGEQHLAAASLAVVPFALDDLAALAGAEGDARRALRLAGAADAQHERLATFRADNIRAWVERYLAAAWASLPRAAADAEWVRGRAMTLEEAVADALKSR